VKFGTAVYRGYREYRPSLVSYQEMKTNSHDVRNTHVSGERWPIRDGNRLQRYRAVICVTNQPLITFITIGRTPVDLIKTNSTVTKSQSAATCTEKSLTRLKLRIHYSRVV